MNTIRVVGMLKTLFLLVVVEEKVIFGVDNPRMGLLVMGWIKRKSCFRL